MTPPLRFGILGAGNIATKSVAPAISAVRNARLVAIASREFQKAKMLANQYGARALENYENLIQDPEIDCVYITLPNSLHAEWSMKAASNGKHVLCEKPAFCSLQEAKAVLKTCHQNKVRFLEGTMFRFHPQHATVLNWIDTGKLGEVTHLEAAFGIPKRSSEDIRMNPELGGGAFNDLGGYLVSVARFIFQSEPLKAEVSFHFEKEGGVDLRGVLHLEFSNHRFAQLSFGFDRFYRNEYTLWGSKGRLHVGRAFSIPHDYKPEILFRSEEGVKTISVPPANQFEKMVEAFCESILSGASSNQGDFETEALQQAKVMDQIRQKGRPFS